MEDATIKILSSIGWPGAVVAIVIVLYKAGLLNRLTGKQNGKHLKDIEELKAFKQDAETNHFHDLEELKGEVRELRDEISGMRERLARLEVKVFNGYKPPFSH